VKNHSEKSFQQNVIDLSWKIAGMESFENLRAIYNRLNLSLLMPWNCFVYSFPYISTMQYGFGICGRYFIQFCNWKNVIYLRFMCVFEDHDGS